MTVVVVVDDEMIIADVLAAALNDEGYTVITAMHGLHAMERLDHYPHAKLVLSDFIMPVMDGAGLLRAMRQCPVHGKTPCILMSTMPEAHVRRHAQGYTAFLKKPFALSNVIDLVAHILGPDRRPALH